MNPQSQLNDVVSVQLSAEGIAAAKGGPLTVHGGGVELSFTGAAAQQVHLAVWNETLKTICPFGKPWFELAPAVAPAATTQPPAKPVVAGPAPTNTSAK